MPGFGLFMLMGRSLSALECKITQTAGSAAGTTASTTGISAVIPVMTLLGIKTPLSELFLWSLFVTCLGLCGPTPLADNGGRQAPLPNRHGNWHDDFGHIRTSPGSRRQDPHPTVGWCGCRVVRTTDRLCPKSRDAACQIAWYPGTHSSHSLVVGSAGGGIVTSLLEAQFSLEWALAWQST